MNDARHWTNALAYEGRLSRRLLLAYGASLASLPLIARQSAAADRPISFASNPFTQGVSSGDPDDQSVVLWTRLAPAPTEPGGGLPPEPLEVRYEVAEDDQFARLAASGAAVATPQLAHTVHVEVRGLQPDRWYFYRFRAGDAESPVGRTRTLPAPHAKPARLRFAFASCQHYEYGLYTAYSQMARDNLDLVFHLGDYIYEYGGVEGRVRQHLGKEIKSLDDYRSRYAQYRSDPLLTRMHAACPWFVTWDDHEFDNNYANGVSEEKDIDPRAFLDRRANAYQAYYEAMPLRARSLPTGPDMRLYRKASFGRLAEFMILDTRQYRSDQPNSDAASPLNEAALDPRQTLLGARQRGWLQSSLISSPATWNVLAQQVMMGMVASAREATVGKYSMDQWPGYAHERMALVKFLAERRIPNPITIAGDIHSNWANELRIDDRQPDSPIVCSEFVGTSISSGGNGLAAPPYLPLLKQTNPFVKFHTTERGYVRCEVTPERWRTDYVAVEDVLKPDGPISVRASFVVEAGRPGIQSGG